MSDTTADSQSPAPGATADPANCKVTSEWKYEASPLIGCRFDPTGRVLLTGGQDHRVQRWDLASGEHKSLAGHDSWVRAFAFAPDGARAWSGGYDGRLIAWPMDTDATEPIQVIEAHQGWIRAVAVSPDGKLLASAGNDQKVRLWDTADHRLVAELSGHDRHVYSVMFDVDSQRLFSGDLRGVIKIWDVQTHEAVGGFEATELYSPNQGQGAEYGGVRSMALVPGTHSLCCGGLYKASNPFGAVQSPLVEVYDCEQGTKLRSLIAKDDPAAICWRVVAHPAGFAVGACGGAAGGFLCFWRGEETTEFVRFGLPNIVYDMDLHPDGQRLATVHRDGHVRITSMVG